jgi:hypothetical protein
MDMTPFRPGQVARDVICDEWIIERDGEQAKAMVEPGTIPAIKGWTPVRLHLANVECRLIDA